MNIKKLKFYQLARADTRISMMGVRQITIDHQSIGSQDGSRKELLLESLRRGQVKFFSLRILFPISGNNSVFLSHFLLLFRRLGTISPARLSASSKGSD